MDNKDAEKLRSDSNNAEVAKVAGKVYLTSHAGVIGNAITKTKLYDKAGDIAGQALTSANRTLPGSQRVMNTLAETGAANDIASAVGSTQKDGNDDLIGKNASKNEAQNSIDNNNGEGLNDNSSSVSDSNNNDNSEKKKNDKNKKIAKKAMKNPVVVGAIITGSLLLLAVVLLLSLNDQSGTAESRASYLNFYSNALESENPEFDDYFTSEEETAKIIKVQKSLANQVDRVYRSYLNEFFHPGLAKYPEMTADGTLDKTLYEPSYEEFLATKMHVMSTLFLQYTPATFSENIDQSDSLFNDTTAYSVCNGDDGCEGGLPSSDYEPETIKENIKNKSLEETINYYRKEKDDVRKLVRNTIVYKNVCQMSDCVYGADIGQEKCISDVTKNAEVLEYEEVSFFDFLLRKTIFGQILALFDKDLWDCKSHIDSGTPVGKLARLFSPEKEDGFRHDFQVADYNIVEDTDICSYYEWLIEDDYLDNKYRLKEEFKTINTENYEEFALKYKIEYAKEIIESVSLANNDEPVSIKEGSRLDLYTVNKDILITVTDTKNGGTVGTYPIDLYVQGVLSREVGGFYGNRKNLGASADQVKEGWKAMAIAIRSYALARTKGGVNPIGNTAKDQVFSPEILLDPIKANTEAALVMRAAALETSGLVLMNNNNFFSAEYDSFNDDSMYCDGEFCYSNYLKKGSTNSIYHWVKIPASWEGYVNGGHGRGMSQLGVYYLASLGWTYARMIEYFYGDQVNLHYMDYEEITENNILYKDAYKNIDFAGNGNNQGEAVLGCNYGLEIPLRTTGLTNFDIYGFAGLLCKSEGQVVNGKTCSKVNVNDKPSYLNQRLLLQIQNGTGYVDQNTLAYLSEDEILQNKAESKESETININDSQPYEIFGTFDNVYTNNEIVDNARSFVGKKAHELSYYFNTKNPWSGAFISFLFKVSPNNSVRFRGNEVRYWMNYFEYQNSFYHSDYWSQKTYNPYYYESKPSINSVSGPKVGDIVFFFNNSCNYEGNGIGEELSYLKCYKHMGIVSNVTKNTITYVHGNTSECGDNGVCETTKNRLDSYIVGYGKYSGVK